MTFILIGFIGEYFILACFMLNSMLHRYDDNDVDNFFARFSGLVKWFHIRGVQIMHFNIRVICIRLRKDSYRASKTYLSSPSSAKTVIIHESLVSNY